MYIHPLANASSKVIFGVDISKTVAIIEFLRIVYSTGTGTDTSKLSQIAVEEYAECKAPLQFTVG